MNGKKRTMVLFGLAVAIAIVLGIGLTRAFMKNATQSAAVSELSINSCAKLSFTEGSSSINITNAVPKTDNLGLNTTPYAFTLKNFCTDTVSYKVYIAPLNTNTIADSKMKFALKDHSTGTIIASGLVSSLTDSTSEFDTGLMNEAKHVLNGTPAVIYTLDTSSLNTDASKSYDLYLWVTSTAESEVNNKTFAAGVIAREVTS